MGVVVDDGPRTAGRPTYFKLILDVPVELEKTSLAHETWAD